MTPALGWLLPLWASFLEFPIAVLWPARHLIMITSYICMVLYSLQWVWNFCMYQNHLKSLVKQRLLSLIPRVSDWKGLRYDQRICISFKFQVILLMSRPPFENHWPYCIVTQYKVTWGWWGRMFPIKQFTQVIRRSKVRFKTFSLECIQQETICISPILPPAALQDPQNPPENSIIQM